MPRKGLFYRRKKMSWYRRKPRKNEPHKHAYPPHRTSPATEKILEEAKKTGPIQDKLESKSDK